MQSGLLLLHSAIAGGLRYGLSGQGAPGRFHVCFVYGLHELCPRHARDCALRCAAQVLDLLKAEDAARKPGTPYDTNADKYFLALKLACEVPSKPKMKSIALDALHKLIAYGYLQGKASFRVMACHAFALSRRFVRAQCARATMPST